MFGSCIGSDFSNSVHHSVHQDTVVQTRGHDLHLRFRADGEFAEQLELEDFPFDTQELTVKLIIHCIIGGLVGIEVRRFGYEDEHTNLEAHGMRAVPKKGYNAAAIATAPPMSLPHDIFKVDSFHLHNVWDMSNDVSGSISVHASEFPQLSMACLVRRKPHFYLWNVVVTMILLEMMSLASYVLDPADIEGISGRIGLALTLVLTCGIYRSANAQVGRPSQPATRKLRAAEGAASLSTSSPHWLVPCQDHA